MALDNGGIATPAPGDLPSTAVLAAMVLSMTTPAKFDGFAEPAQRKEPDVTELPTGRRWAALGGEVILGSIVAVVVSLGLQWIISRLSWPHPSQVPTALIMLAGVLLLAITLLLATRRKWARWLNPLTWV